MAPTELTFGRLVDPVIDAVGHDGDSDYVERFWLPVLGPSCILVLRRLTRYLRDDTTVVVEAVEFAGAMGMAPAHLVKTLHRLRTFQLAMCTSESDWTISVRLPPLARRHLMRLPASLVAAHEILTGRAA